MERLAHEPATLKDLVEADLRRAARLIVRIQDEVDPQLRIATPQGDFHVAMTLPGDPEGVQQMFGALSVFMAYRQALGFTMASEIVEPNALYCVGCLGADWLAALSMKSEKKPFSDASFGPLQWLPDESIGAEIRALLPRGQRSISKNELAACEALFGISGRFPAVHIASGEIRGLD